MKKRGRPTKFNVGKKDSGVHWLRLPLSTIKAIRAESNRTGIPITELERRALYDRFCAPVKKS